MKGEPWFCLLDVCNILGIENNRNVVNRLESGCVHTTDIPTYGMNQLSNPYLSNIGIENNRNVVNRLESDGVHTTDMVTSVTNQLSNPYLSNIDIGV